MSLVGPVGVDTADTSYLTMAAGSDRPESVEASPVVVEKANYPHHHHHHHHHHSHHQQQHQHQQIYSSGSSHHSHSYIGLPYADHNYGARPPPTPPASPPPVVLIRPGEGGLLVGGGVGVGVGVDEASRGTTLSTSEDGSYGADITRCICGFTHDDGYMICCDKCSVWQHIDCMGIDRQHIPETYLCERCQPRSLDRERAILLQTRKRENMSDGDTSATESGDEVPLELYSTFQHTPTTLTLTTGRLGGNKQADKKRKKSGDKEPPPTARAKKAFREGSRKSSRVKGSAPDVDPSECGSLWESKMKVWMDRYEEASSNQYSDDVQTLLRIKENSLHTKNIAYNTHSASFKPPVESQVQKNKRILKAVRDLAPDSLIIEYRGKFMLRQQFEANGYFFKRPYPFVLFYSKFDGLEMCVDARNFGNDARFIRRSCTPNAEVRHVIEDGMLHLYIYSLRHVSKGSEITIGFDYDYGSCKYKVDCACVKNHECPVLKHNLEPTENLGLAGVEARRRSRGGSGGGGGGGGGTGGRKDKELLVVRDRGDHGDEGLHQNQNMLLDGEAGAKAKSLNQDGKQRKLSPLRLSISNNQEPEFIEDLEEKASVSNEVEMESEEQIAEKRRKMTREERKMEAILQAFARMEKREKRREQALERISTKTEPPCRSGIDIKEEPPATPEADSPASLQPLCDGIKEEPKPILVGTGGPGIGIGIGAGPATGPTAAKVSRSKQRKSFSRGRTHIGQQRRRARTISVCSDLPPGSPADSLEPLGPGEHLEGGPPDGTAGIGGLAASGGVGGLLEPGDMALPQRTPDASPPHSGSPAPTPRHGSKYPKTKKHLVSEWMGGTDCKQQDPRSAARTPEPPPPDRPLRISSDPEVLATQLNALPGLALSPHVYTTPKHYVRFSSPFLAQRSPTAPGLPTARRRSREMPDTPPTSGSCKKRWLKQALEEEGSTSPGGHSSLLMTSEGPLSPPLNGDSDSPLPYNGGCPIPELPTPLKKRRLCPLDACMSESSTPYGSPCATPTRADLSEAPGTPLQQQQLLLATPPRTRHHDDSLLGDPLPTTPATPAHTALAALQGSHTPQGPLTPYNLQPEGEMSQDSSPEGSRRSSTQEVERAPSLLSSPSVRPTLLPPSSSESSTAPTTSSSSSSSSSSALDQRPLGAQSPSHDTQDSIAAAGGDDGVERETGPDGEPVQQSSETSTPTYPPWMKSPERSAAGGGGGGNLSFSPVNSNLRDLTPSHTLEMGGFRLDASGAVVPVVVAVAATGAAVAAGAASGVVGAPAAAFTEGAPFYPCGEEGAAMGFSRSLSVDGSGEGGGSAQNPPPKKKVSLLEYRKRQREARRSGGSKAECSSPVATVPPADLFHGVTMETVVPEAPPQQQQQQQQPQVLQQPTPLPLPLPQPQPQPQQQAAPQAAATPQQPGEEADGAPQGDREAGEGNWTSSTSVEQARERIYHRALLLSDHRKDKDADDAESGEGVPVRDCPSPKSCKSPPTHTPCSPGPSSRLPKEEECETPTRPTTSSQQQQQQQQPPQAAPKTPVTPKPTAPLTPTRLHPPSSTPQGHYTGPPPPSSLLHSPKPSAPLPASPFRGQRSFQPTSQQPQAQAVTVAPPPSGPPQTAPFVPYGSPQSAPPPPPPPPPAPPASAAYFPAQSAPTSVTVASPFQPFQPGVGVGVAPPPPPPFAPPPGSQALLHPQPHPHPPPMHYQTCTTGAPPPPPPPPPPPTHTQQQPPPGPTLLHVNVNMAPQHQHQHQVLLSSAHPPPPPPPPQQASQSQLAAALKQQQQQQGPPPPPPPPPPPAPSSVVSAPPPLPSQTLGAYQAPLLHPPPQVGVVGPPPVSSYCSQVSGLPPPPPPPPQQQQQQPQQQNPPPTQTQPLPLPQAPQSRAGTVPPPPGAPPPSFHNAGYMGTGWH
ncbi:inactive histone-lysine N-methyltransferase 2E [Engraulis encrasicolus]|uniref:inactive histone-lysine N-methyltransferase 2E n=1 Tax=Engraulis encrasicolus TaxID=184585 RepID=UPI002FD241C7